MSNRIFDYDVIAETIFYPAYDEIIDDVVRRMNVTQGEFLDIGCGGGHLGFALMKRTAMQGCFLDIHVGAVEIAQNRAIDLGFADRTVVKQGNVENMPFPDNTFDLIVSRGSVPFWENQKKAFKEILRVMKPGGKAYIGGGLGTIETQQQIQKKLEAIGKSRFGTKRKHKEKSNALTIEEYKKLFETMDCKYNIISNEQHKRLILLEKE